jgi:uncharacterized caspase-like protein
MFRKLFLAVLVMAGIPLLGQGRAVTAVTRSVTELPAAQKRWALLIGVRNYQDAGITKPDHAEHDAEALSDALTRYASFPSEQVIVLATNKDSSRQPTRGNILRFLAHLGGLVPADGLLLVAFSGHGVERNKRIFLLPSDAQLSDNVLLLEDTAVSLDALRKWIENTKAAQKIVLLDSCRNDPAAGRGDTANILSSAYTSALRFDIHNAGVEAYATLYATSVGDRAYEYPSKKQGFFTWAVVQGLAGQAANPDGSVTLGSLVRYVQAVVPKLVRLEFGPGKKQVPYAAVEGYRADELVISGNVPASPAVVEVELPHEPAETAAARAVENLPEGVDRGSNGQLILRAGWEWVDPVARTQTRLKPGYQRGTDPGTIRPHDAWEWVKPEDKKNYDVRVKEGLQQAEDDPRKVVPRPGWEWVHPNMVGDYAVRLKPGYQRGDARGEIKPAAGWEWVEPANPQNYEVRRITTAFHLPGIRTNVVGVRFFEGSDDTPLLAQRQYATAFSRSSARYVYIELEVKRDAAGTATNVAVPCTFTRPDGTVKGVAEVTVDMHADWTGSYHVRGWGAKQGGTWEAGRHRVSCSFNGVVVAWGEFDIR